MSTVAPQIATTATRMQAVAVSKALPVDAEGAFLDIDLPLPSLRARDLLVRMSAISVNPADFRSRARKADDGEVKVLGWDAVGTVIDTGSGVTRFAVGDEVYYAGDTSRPGTNSALHAVDERIVARRPDGIGVEQAAALPLVTLTAWEALFDRFRLSRTGIDRHRSILILGGAGGVGSMAIQFARLVPGLRVIASASRPESAAWCRELGAHDVIDHHAPLRTQLTALGLVTVDMILILNSPDAHYPAVADCVSPQGMVACIVPFRKPVDLNLLMRKSVSFHWELMFTRALYETSDMARQGEILEEVGRLVDAGTIRSPLKRVLSPFHAATVREAHAILETDRMIGKLVITGFPDDMAPAAAIGPSLP